MRKNSSGLESMRMYEHVMDVSALTSRKIFFFVTNDTQTSLFLTILFIIIILFYILLLLLRGRDEIMNSRWVMKGKIFQAFKLEDFYIF